MHLQDLKKKKTHELLQLAAEYNIENAANMRRQDIMFSILKSVADKGTAIHGDGVIDILQDGFGFLRAPESNYLPGPDDIYVSPSQIRKFGLRNGDTVEGEIRQPKDSERYFALLKVTTINFTSPEKVRNKINFDNLTPLYPNYRIHLEIDSSSPEAKKKNMSTRIMELVSPIGKGQRALIVSPPRTGKTVFLQSIAHSIEVNHK